MKLKITMKSPDGVDVSISRAAREYADSLPDLSKEERQEAYYDHVELLGDIASKWILYGEYLTVVIDTETETIEVQEAH